MIFCAKDWPTQPSEFHAAVEAVLPSEVVPLQTDPNNILQYTDGQNFWSVFIDPSIQPEHCSALVGVYAAEGINSYLLFFAGEDSSFLPANWSVVGGID